MQTHILVQFDSLKKRPVSKGMNLWVLFNENFYTPHCKNAFLICNLNAFLVGSKYLKLRKKIY